MFKAFIKGMLTFRSFRVRMYTNGSKAKAYKAGRELAHILTFNMFRF